MALHTTSTGTAESLAEFSAFTLQGSILCLLLISMGSEAISSLRGNPYSLEAPKRVIVQHLHTLDANGKLNVRHPPRPCPEIVAIL